MESSTRCVWRHLWVLASSYLGLYHHGFDADIYYNHIHSNIISSSLCRHRALYLSIIATSLGIYMRRGDSYNRQNAPQACRSPLRWPSASGHRGHAANFGTSVPTPRYHLSAEAGTIVAEYWNPSGPSGAPCRTVARSVAALLARACKGLARLRRGGPILHEEYCYRGRLVRTPHEINNNPTGLK